MEMKMEFNYKVLQIKNRLESATLAANAAGTNHGFELLGNVHGHDTTIDKQRQDKWKAEQKGYEAEINALLEDLKKLYEEKGNE